MVRYFVHKIRASGISWGVYLNIGCVTFPLTEYKGEISLTMDNLHISLTYYKTKGDLMDKTLESMAQGLLLISSVLKQKIDVPIVIEVQELDWPNADFQLEAFGYGLAGWLIQEYNLEVELPTPVYDKKRGYIYPYRIEGRIGIW